MIINLSIPRQYQVRCIFLRVTGIDGIIKFIGDNYMCNVSLKIQILSIMKAKMNSNGL